MKIILKQDHDLLGATGEIKEVKDGYARNYLIPRGIALAVTPSNLKAFEEIRRQQSRKIQKEIEEAKKLSGDLNNLTLNFTVKTAEDDKIYGSVTAQMIYNALKEKGYENIERKKILLHDHIKTLGEHTVDIKLHTNVAAKLKILVEKEKVEEEHATAENTQEEVANTENS
ncbi:MAG: 50S ribosomal protein L9 [Ignavibacteriae bacterium]|nr:50S ribosomal protein L9 [Ignavibacteriota bacterium]